MTNTSLEVIGYVRCDYKEKFGIPRQSGLTGRAAAFIEILPPYNQAEAFRGLDGFSHIWLLWDFSRAHKNGFTATVIWNFLPLPVLNPVTAKTTVP